MHEHRTSCNSNYSNLTQAQNVKHKHQQNVQCTISDRKHENFLCHLPYKLEYSHLVKGNGDRILKLKGMTAK